MKKIAFALLTLVAGISFMACGEDNEVIPATFKGFQYTPNPVQPGDTVTIRAIYASKGKYVNKPRCTWNLKLDTLATNGTYQQVTLSRKLTCSIGDEDLSVRFVIPETAKEGQQATCSFDVSFNNIVDASNIGFSINSQTEEGYVGRFNSSTVQSIIYSHTSGNLTLNIGQKKN